MMITGPDPASYDPNFACCGGCSSSQRSDAYNGKLSTGARVFIWDPKLKTDPAPVCLLSFPYDPALNEQLGERRVRSGRLVGSSYPIDNDYDHLCCEQRGQCLVLDEDASGKCQCVHRWGFTGDHCQISIVNAELFPNATNLSSVHQFLPDLRSTLLSFDYEAAIRQAISPSNATANSFPLLNVLETGSYRQFGWLTTAYFILAAAGFALLFLLHLLWTFCLRKCGCRRHNPLAKEKIYGKAPKLLWGTLMVLTLGVGAAAAGMTFLVVHDDIEPLAKAAFEILNDTLPINLTTFESRFLSPMDELLADGFHQTDGVSLLLDKIQERALLDLERHTFLDNQSYAADEIGQSVFALLEPLRNYSMLYPTVNSDHQINCDHMNITTPSVLSRMTIGATTGCFKCKTCTTLVDLVAQAHDFWRRNPFEVQIDMLVSKRQLQQFGTMRGTLTPAIRNFLERMHLMCADFRAVNGRLASGFDEVATEISQIAVFGLYGHCGISVFTLVLALSAFAHGVMTGKRKLGRLTCFFTELAFLLALVLTGVLYTMAIMAQDAIIVLQQLDANTSLFLPSVQTGEDVGHLLFDRNLVNASRMDDVLAFSDTLRVPPYPTPTTDGPERFDIPALYNMPTLFALENLTAQPTEALVELFGWEETFAQDRYDLLKAFAFGNHTVASPYNGSLPQTLLNSSIQRLLDPDEDGELATANDLVEIQTVFNLSWRGKPLSISKKDRSRREPTHSMYSQPPFYGASDGRDRSLSSPSAPPVDSRSFGFQVSPSAETPDRRGSFPNQQSFMQAPNLQQAYGGAVGSPVTVPVYPQLGQNAPPIAAPMGGGYAPQQQQQQQQQTQYQQPSQNVVNQGTTTAPATPPMLHGGYGPVHGGSFAPRMPSVMALLPDGLAPTPSSVVELRFRCKGLKKSDLISESDPFIVLYIQEADAHGWREVGRTETVRNTSTPNFTKAFQLDFFFEEVQRLRIEVFDRDSSSEKLSAHDFLGCVEITMGQLMASAGQSVVLSLLQNDRGRHVRGLSGHVVIDAEEVSTCADMLNVKFAATKVDNKDGWFGASDPFLNIYRLREENADPLATTSWLLVWRSEAIMDNNNPKWRRATLSVQSLCNGNLSRLLKIECMDWEKNGRHQFIGSCTVKAAELVAGEMRSIDLINRERQARKGKRYKNSGVLIVEEIECFKQHTFAEYLRGGCEVSLIVGIDYTASNGSPSDPASLHYTGASYAGQMNDYQAAISATGAILEPYDSDKRFPVYGFGGMVNGVVDHCFPLTFDPSQPEVEGIGGVLGAYANSFQFVRLHGPTKFAPLIRQAATIAATFSAPSQQMGGGGSLKYFVLLIITDGAIMDMQQTIDELVPASTLPLSIVIVAVGNADFSAMNALDADGKLLIDSRRQRAARDMYREEVIEANMVTMETPPATSDKQQVGGHGQNQESSSRSNIIALLLVLSYVAVSVLVFHYTEKWSVVDAVYYAMVIVTTVGYGDVVPVTTAGKTFTIFFSLYGIFTIGVALGQLASWFLQRQKSITKLATKKLLSSVDNAAAVATVPTAVKDKVEAVGVMSPSGTKMKAKDWRPQWARALCSRSNMAILHAFIPIVVSLVAGLIVGAIEGWPVLDCFYYTVITITTVGFGDLSPKSEAARIFAIFYLPLAVVTVAHGIGSILNELSARSVMKTKISMKELLAMDTDGDGKVSQLEYMCYMLVKLNKADQDDIDGIIAQFHKLDRDGSGELDRDDLERLDRELQRQNDEASE
ncbi:hypothetical protein BBJ28_00006899 [Nothophytophthora sp. Chile5]|nr:hypothetical protein BBJ28_00006899 [Nothophytophthora sp. Chile5]